MNQILTLREAILDLILSISQSHSIAHWPGQGSLLRSEGRPALPGSFSFCAVHQFLAGDAVPNPRKGLESLRIDFLPAINTLLEGTLVDPLQCPLHYTQHRPV